MEDVKVKYEEWREAVMKADTSSLDKIYTEDFLWTNSLGISQRKVESIDKVKAGVAKYMLWKIEELDANVKDAVAVVRSKEMLRMVVYDQLVTTTRKLSATFINSQGEWRLDRVEEEGKKLD